MRTLNQNTISKKLGISSTLLSTLLRNKPVKSVGIAKMLGRKLGISFCVFLDDSARARKEIKAAIIAKYGGMEKGKHGKARA